MVSNLLYEKRFGPYFIEPIIAALDPKTNEPFISVMDLIGQPCVCEDFAVAGCANEQLYGMCEALWQPNLVRVFKQHTFEVLIQNTEIFILTF